MPKSLTTKFSGFLVAHLHNRYERGIAWGCLAGAGMGAGIILNIDLFSHSTVSLIYLVVIFSSAMGAMFGHVMAGMLENEVTTQQSGHRRPAVDYKGLSEHKALKLQMHARNTGLHVPQMSYANAIASSSIEQSMPKHSPMRANA